MFKKLVKRQSFNFYKLTFEKQSTSVCLRYFCNQKTNTSYSQNENNESKKLTYNLDNINASGIYKSSSLQLSDKYHLTQVRAICSLCSCLQKQQSSIFHKYKAVMNAPEGVFRGNTDRFNGITVLSQVEYDSKIVFEEKLKKSIDYWKENKRRAIWFKVEKEHSEWIPILVKNGFNFHHAKENFVVMTRWLPTEEDANLPTFAHTMIGVGGLVINDKREVLVVSDRYAMIPNSWKLPGGYVEPSEDLIVAAKREVFEETGVETEFKTVISIRHTHGVSFECSDIYVVIGLTPKTLNLLRCDREIAKCEWMAIDKFLNHPNVHETNRHFMRTYLNYEKKGIRIVWEKGQHQFLKKEYFLYFAEMNEANEI